MDKRNFLAGGLVTLGLGICGKAVYDGVQYDDWTRGVYLYPVLQDRFFDSRPPEEKERIIEEGVQRRSLADHYHTSAQICTALGIIGLYVGLGLFDYEHKKDDERASRKVILLRSS